jgi:hypothetical protein
MAQACAPRPPATAALLLSQQKKPLNHPSIQSPPPQQQPEHPESLSAGAVGFCVMLLSANALAIWCECHNPTSFLQELGGTNSSRPENTEHQLPARRRETNNNDENDDHTVSSMQGKRYCADDDIRRDLFGGLRYK